MSAKPLYCNMLWTFIETCTVPNEGLKGNGPSRLNMRNTQYPHACKYFHFTSMRCNWYTQRGCIRVDTSATGAFVRRKESDTAHDTGGERCKFA